MGFEGEFEFIKDIAIGANFSVSKTSMVLEADLGCIPPMQKFSLNVPYSMANIPTRFPGFVNSDCMAEAAEFFANAASTVGHTLWNAAETIGNAFYSVASSFKGKKQPKTNADIPLYETAVSDRMTKRMLDDMKAKGIDKIDVTSIDLSLSFKPPAGFRGLKTYATRKMLREELKRIGCRADGRIAHLLMAQAGFGSYSLQSIETELSFYPDFQARRPQIQRMLDEKPIVRGTGGILTLSYSEERKALDKCKNS